MRGSIAPCLAHSRDDQAQRPPLRFGDPDPGERGQHERCGADQQGGAESALFRKRPDQVGRRSARQPTDVIGDPLRGRANGGGIDFRGHRAEPAEVACRGKRDQRAEHEQDRWDPHGHVDGQQGGSRDEVGDVGSLAAEPIAHEPEGHVAEPHSNLHHDHEGRRSR